MKFTIRDLFLVTVIVALAVGWAVDHWQYSSADRELLREIKEERRRIGEWQSYPPINLKNEFPNSVPPAANPSQP